MRKSATIVFALVGLLALAFSIAGDPCEPHGIWPIFAVAAMLSSGVVVFSVVEARTRHIWIPISAGIVSGMAVGAGAWVVAIVRWAENCSR